MTGSIAYDSIAARDDETRGGLVRGASFARSFAAALGEVDGPVLDLGVGTGAVALPLRELGYEVVGLDLSLPMLSLAHARLGPSVVRGDGMQLPVRSGSLGAVTMSWVLQLVADQAQVLAECRRALRPGGRVATIVATPVEVEPPDFAPIITALGERLGMAVDERVDEAQAAAAAAGLEVAGVLETPADVFDESPAGLAENIESRLFGGLIGLSDEEFAAKARPAVDALLALPEPERPRRRSVAHPLLVLRPHSRTA